MRYVKNFGVVCTSRLQAGRVQTSCLCAIHPSRYIATMVGLVLSLPLTASAQTYLTQWGSAGTGNGQFSSPQAVAVDVSGNVYVADSGNNRIQKFSATGAYLTQWGSAGSGNGQFSTPQGVAVDVSGNVYVADSGNHRIQKFSATGTYLTQWGSFGSGNGQFSNPRGIAIGASGSVFVADSGNARIQAFTPTGTDPIQWSTSGSPFGIAIDASDFVYVAEKALIGVDYTVGKFTVTGALLESWHANANDTPSNPTGIAADAAGNVYLSMAFTSLSGPGKDYRIVKLTSSGAYITQWGLTGTGNGQFDNPLGLSVDSSGNIYAVDSGNSRVQVFLPIPLPRPTIGAVSAPQTLNGTVTATIRANSVSGENTISRVWAVIAGPETTGGAANVTLTAVGGGDYAAVIDAFTDPGVYWVRVYAVDIYGSVSMPSSTSVTQQSVAALPDIYEPDNTPQTAPSLPEHVMQWRNFHTSGDVDWVYIPETLERMVSVAGFGLDAKPTFSVYIVDALSPNGVSLVSGLEGFQDSLYFPAGLGACYLRIANADATSFGKGTEYTVLLSPVILQPINGYPGALSGVVTNALTHLPIPNAVVQLAPSMLTTQSDSQGVYSFSTLSSGFYTVIATAQNFSSAPLMIYVQQPFTSVADLVLTDVSTSVLSVACAGASPTNAASISFTVTFNESVSGVAAHDFAVTANGAVSGASVTSVSGTGATYTVAVSTGTGDGSIRLDVIDDDTIIGALSSRPLGGAGLGNGAFTGGEVYTIVKTRPSVSLSSVAPLVTHTSPIPVTVTFSTPVNGFTLDDITASNASVAQFSGAGAVYSFDLVPTVPGMVGASIPGGAAVDIAGNASLPSAAPFTRTYTRPVDIDGSGAIDAVDVQLVINSALGLSIVGDADVNHDGSVDAVDVQLVINAALGL